MHACGRAGFSLWASKVNAAGGVKVADALGTSSYNVQVRRGEGRSAAMHCSTSGVTGCHPCAIHSRWAPGRATHRATHACGLRSPF